jgi:hypothetical protein
MKGKTTIALLVILIVSALAYCVSAQVQPDTQTQQYQKAREAFRSILLNYQAINGSQVAGNGAKAPVTVCTGPTMATDGTAKCLYQALPASGKLHIEMQDGAIQEVDLKNVKKMTVE